MGEGLGSKSKEDSVSAVETSKGSIMEGKGMLGLSWV